MGRPNEQAGWLIERSTVLPICRSGTRRIEARNDRRVRRLIGRRLERLCERVTRRFLRDDEPPRHLTVEASGTVRIQTGPREAVGDDEPDAGPAPDIRAAQATHGPRNVRPSRENRDVPTRKYTGRLDGINLDQHVTQKRRRGTSTT
jgi:hypothetical protein